MTDREIDRIGMLVFQLTGEMFEPGATAVLIRALEAGANAADLLREKRDYDKALDA